MKCGQQKQLGRCGRGQTYGRRKPGHNRELKEDFRIRGIFSLSVARSTKQTKKFYPQIALSWRQALQKTTARWTNSSTFLCASRWLVLSNLTQLQGIWNCTETKRLKPSTSNVRNKRKQKLYLNSGLTLISIKSHLSCVVDLIKIYSYFNPQDYYKNPLLFLKSFQLTAFANLLENASSLFFQNLW